LQGAPQGGRELAAAEDRLDLLVRQDDPSRRRLGDDDRARQLSKRGEE